MFGATGKSCYSINKPSVNTTIIISLFSLHDLLSFWFSLSFPFEKKNWKSSHLGRVILTLTKMTKVSANFALRFSIKKQFMKDLILRPPKIKKRMKLQEIVPSVDKKLFFFFTVLGF